MTPLGSGGGARVTRPGLVSEGLGKQQKLASGGLGTRQRLASGGLGTQQGMASGSQGTQPSLTSLDLEMRTGMTFLDLGTGLGLTSPGLRKYPELTSGTLETLMISEAWGKQRVQTWGAREKGQLCGTRGKG